MRIPRLTSTIAVLLALPVLAACTENAGSGGSGDAAADDRTITVTSSDDACEISGSEAAAGTLTFEVTNTGTTEHEFEIFKGEAVVDEIEGLVPGLTKDLTVTLEAGDYTFVCKLAGHEEQGMKGTLTVTGG